MISVYVPSDPQYEIMPQKAYISVSVCTCFESLINAFTLSLSLLRRLLCQLQAESNLSLGMTLAVDAALWLAALTLFDRFFWEMVLLLSNLSYLSVSPSVTLSILIWSSQLLRFGPWVCSNVSYRAICSTVSLIFSQLLAVWEENLRECSLRRPGSAALKFACCLALKLMHPCCLTSAPSVLYSHIHIYIS